MLNSCVILEIVRSPTPTEEPPGETVLDSTPTGDATPEIFADCFINFYLSAWIDENGNGVWESSELPLAGVDFRIDGQFALMLSEYPCISDAEGQCTLRIWSPGMCTARDYTISATPPDFLKATTPEEIIFQLTARQGSGEAQFGFCSDLDE